MKASEIVRRIKEIAVVPIVRTPDLKSALAGVEAVLAGGIDCVEITMTVPNALKAIESVADRYGDKVLLGAGTVLDPETARACMLAGAQFIVSPALNVATIELCRRYDVAVFPGGLTPTEVITAWQAGADAVKVFPCSAVGGAKYLKALKAPLPQVELIPTGGVSLATAAEFLEAGAIALGVGGDLVDNKAIKAGKPEIVTENARKYLEIVHAHHKKSA